MATIKSTTQQLGSLINQINGAGPNMGGNYAPVNNGIAIDDESIPNNMLETTPVFEMNYKSVKKQSIKKAKDSIVKIVKEVVPDSLQNAPLIQDKINQDAEQLGSLYYEYEKTDKIVQALMETIGRGELQARLFEVYAKMSKMIQELSQQITETQNNFRKYYIDTYMDLQQKADADHVIANGQKNIAIDAGSSASAQALPEVSESNIIVGTEDLTKMLNEKKKAALLAKFEETKS